MEHCVTGEKTLFRGGPLEAYLPEGKIWEIWILCSGLKGRRPFWLLNPPSRVLACKSGSGSGSGSVNLDISSSKHV